MEGKNFRDSLFTPQATALAYMGAKVAGDHRFFKRACKSLQGSLVDSQLYHVGMKEAWPSSSLFS